MYFLILFIKPFSVCTPMGYSKVATRVYRKCPIMMPNRVTLVYLVELDMFDFYNILGMDWPHAFLAYVDCTTRVVKFNS